MRIVTRQPASTSATASFSAWRSAPPTTGRNCGQNIKTDRLMTSEAPGQADHVVSRDALRPLTFPRISSVGLWIG